MLGQLRDYHHFNINQTYIRLRWKLLTDRWYYFRSLTVLTWGDRSRGTDVLWRYLLPSSYWIFLRKHMINRCNYQHFSALKCGLLLALTTKDDQNAHIYTWWRHQMEQFSALLALCLGNSPGNSPHKVQWRGALMLSLIRAWTNGWVNNLEIGDLRRHCAHYDVIVLRVNIIATDVLATQLGRASGVTGLTWFAHDIPALLLGLLNKHIKQI